MAFHLHSDTQGAAAQPLTPPCKLQLDTKSGHLQLVWYGDGEPTGPTFDALVDAGLSRRGQRDGGSRITANGIEAWVKGGRLKPKSALRHELRRLLFQRPFPRIQEASNLTWLRAQGIPAVRPLLAGLYSTGYLVETQFLVTEFVPGTIALDELYTVAPKRYAQAHAAAIAIIRAMHLANFEHRDCYKRNFLITKDARALAIDAWRGGPCQKLSKRSQARDLLDFDS